MWLEVDLTSFKVSSEGFRQTRAVGAKALYVSPTLAHLQDIEGLAESEYGQAVEVDGARRTVVFGRDYLGHFPLAYASTKHKLLISDDVPRLIKTLRQQGNNLTLSHEAMALYFSMGYIPDGLTLYREISMCEAHSLYQWRNGDVTRRSLFRPVEIDPAAGLEPLERAIEQEVTRWAGAAGAELDVWCSGGLDSSIMAQRFNDGGRRARLITLGYGDSIHKRHGDGERGYAYEVARACGAPVREVTLSPARFGGVHAAFVRTHNMPVIDTCVPAKYALAEASGPFVITGEGSDPLFAGPKNNMMFHAIQRDPTLPLGWLYALAHRRFFQSLGEIFADGRELEQYVSGYLGRFFERYPGDLLRKLFYLNIHVKASSLIFTESYYAGRARGIAVRHPYSALGVYQAAFRLEDRHKYSFPHDKLTLKAIYGNRIPSVIVQRKKSGTVMPLILYLKKLSADKFDFSALEETGMFKKGFLKRMRTSKAREADPLLAYALVTLNQWIINKGETRHVRLSAKAGHHPEPRAAAAV